MIFKHDGKFGGMQDSSDDISESTNNVLMSLHSGRGDNITRNGKYRIFATVTPIKDFSVTGSMIYEYTNNNTKSIPVFHGIKCFRPIGKELGSNVRKNGLQKWVVQAAFYHNSTLTQR